MHAAPPGKLNEKMGPLLACISVFSILLIFSRFLFLAFFSDCSFGNKDCSFGTSVFITER